VNRKEAQLAQCNDEQVYTSILHSVHHIYVHEGLQGYYRGLGAAIVQIVPYMYAHEALRADGCK
jgi:solute carrier family 25 thiamine pyrophosphate transporter 19